MRVYVGGVYLASDSLTVGLILLYVKARLVGAQDIDKEWINKLGYLFDDHVICFNTCWS